MNMYFGKSIVGAAVSLLLCPVIIWLTAVPVYAENERSLSADSLQIAQEAVQLAPLKIKTRHA